MILIRTRGDLANDSALIPRKSRDAAQKHQTLGPALTEDAIALLVNYDWPGNIRELRNMI